MDGPYFPRARQNPTPNSSPTDDSGSAPEPPNVTPRKHRRYSSTLLPAILLIAVLGFAYSRSQRLSRQTGPAPSASGGHENVMLTAPYSQGRWRIAPRGELRHVVLWVSHILIRHKDAEPTQVAFARMDWQVQPPPPTRSRKEAAALAGELAELARRQPTSFADLARTHSEDLITRDSGGSLGGVTAANLATDSVALDALATMSPGEVSRVIETGYGFHVLQLHPVPGQAQVTGRRIVIGHDAAPWLEFHQRTGKTARRSRADALRIARELSERARAKPDIFEQLIQKYSEHDDAEQKGDIGVWSNREPTPFPRVVEILVGMQVGQISDPIETHLGFEIFQRTTVEPRKVFAVAPIRLHFNPTATDDDPLAKTKRRGVAESISRTLQKQPSRFADFQHQYCCDTVERWTRGRGDLALTTMLDQTPIGAITSTPVVIDYNYVIVKRLDPEELSPEPPPHFDLPAPQNPDLEYLVRHVTPASLAKRTREIAKATEQSLELPPDRLAEFEQMHADLAASFEANAEDEERLRLFHTFQQALESALGKAKFDRYMTLLNEQVTAMLMKK